MSSHREFSAIVTGKASVVIYDHPSNLNSRHLGRYQCVKAWSLPGGKTRNSITYRHQLPAAKSAMLKWLSKFGQPDSVAP